jgi:FkbM family methyltransferase
MSSLKTVATQFREGRIARDDFWSTMRDRHRQLREYQDLIADTTVDSITIQGDALHVRTREGVSMVWDPDDMGTAPNVLVNYGSYESEESLYLLGAAAGAHVIFDIGANVGFYSLHWASRLAPGGTIHSFEPVPSTFSWLVRNIALNNLEDVIRANNIGLGETPTTASLFLPDFTGCGAASMKNLHPSEHSREVTIEIDTLDHYFSAAGLRRLDLLKADVEGAELSVLQGGRDTISEYRPLIFLELLRKWSQPFGYHPNDVIEMLREFGYRCYTFGDGGLVPFAFMSEETSQKNFFFAHPDVHGDWLRTNALA